MALLMGDGTFLAPNIDIDSNWTCKCHGATLGLSAVIVHKTELIYVFSNQERHDPFLDNHPLFQEFICWAPVAFMHRTERDGFSIMSKVEYNNLRLHEDDPVFSASAITAPYVGDAALSDASEIASEMSSDDDDGGQEQSERDENDGDLSDA
jgi:hypothetical protein